MFLPMLGKQIMRPKCGKPILRKSRMRRRLQNIGLHKMRSSGTMFTTEVTAVLIVGVRIGMVRRATVVTTITECLVLIFVPN